MAMFTFQDLKLQALPNEDAIIQAVKQLSEENAKTYNGIMH